MDKIQGPKIGVAYKLVDVETGKSIKALIGGDRLKKNIPLTIEIHLIVDYQA